MNESKPLKHQTNGLASPDKLTQKFGKGFDTNILCNIRRFYQMFPIQETMSLKLSWYHSKDLWCDPYCFNSLNLTCKRLLKANLNKERWA